VPAFRSHNTGIMDNHIITATHEVRLTPLKTQSMLMFVDQRFVVIKRQPLRMLGLLLRIIFLIKRDSFAILFARPFFKRLTLLWVIAEVEHKFYCYSQSNICHTCLSDTDSHSEQGESGCCLHVPYWLHVPY